MCSGLEKDWVDGIIEEFMTTLAHFFFHSAKHRPHQISVPCFVFFLKKSLDELGWLFFFFLIKSSVLNPHLGKQAEIANVCGCHKKCHSQLNWDEKIVGMTMAALGVILYILFCII